MLHFIGAKQYSVASVLRVSGCQRPSNEQRVWSPCATHWFDHAHVLIPKLGSFVPRDSLDGYRDTRMLEGKPEETLE